MARDFSKNTTALMSLGNGALNPALSGKARVTVVAWVNLDSVTSSNANRVLNNLITGSNTTGIRLALTGTRGIELQGRSQSSDGLAGHSGAGTVSLNTWTHIGGVFSFAAGDRRFTSYLNGSFDNNTTGVSWGSASGTFEPGATPTAPDTIGSGPTASDSNAKIDGRIAEMAIYGVELAAADFAALAKGYAPSLIRPDQLLAYWPLVGRAAPEPDHRRGLNAAITGTIPAADHCRILLSA